MLDFSTLKKPSLVLRITIAKATGMAIGLVGFVFLPVFVPEAGWMIRWAVLLWYTTVGAFIGVFGVIDWHPILRIPLPWWGRGPWIGGWMNFVLTLFAYDTLAAMMPGFSMTLFGDAALMVSPFWFVLEGILVGLLIAWVTTRYGGEGKETVGR